MYKLFYKYLVLLISILLLQACSIIKPSVYPKSIGQTPPVQLSLTETQIKQKLEDGYTQWHGTPYGYGRQQVQIAADCSGFTQQVFKQQLAMRLPRTTEAQINSGQKVKLKNAKVGDLVFFDLKNGYGHVGVYMGNNIVMQATSSKGVTKTNLNKEKWWADRVYIIKRILKTNL